MKRVAPGTLIKPLILLLLLTGMGEALAQRNVIINGERLTRIEISQLETLACAPIPDGEYWINLHSGA